MRTLAIAIYSLISCQAYALTAPYKNIKHFNKKSNDYIARELISLTKRMEKPISKRDRERFKVLQSKIKTNKAFLNYLPLVKNIFATRKKYGKNMNIDSCFKNKSQFPKKVLKYLQKKLTKRCLNYYFKNSDKTENFLSVSNHLPFIFENNLKSFINFLPKLSDDQKKKINIVISDHIINSNILPEPSLLMQIEPNFALTAYLQEKKYYEKKRSFQFNRELKRILNRSEYLFNEELFRYARKELQSGLNFLESNIEYISNRKAWRLLVNSGRNLALGDHVDSAVKIFQAGQEVFRQEKYFESMFQGLYARVLENNYRGALQEIKNSSLNQFEQLPLKLQFWIAYTFEKNNHEQRSLDLYQKILDHNPMTYYGVLAFQRLKKNSIKVSPKILSRNPASVPVLEINQSGKYFFERLTAFANAGGQSLLDILIDDYQSMPFNRLFVTPVNQVKNPNQVKSKLLLKFLSFNGNHLDVFKLTYNLMKTGRIQNETELLKLLFPVYYKSYIKKKSPFIDPYWVLSLIRQESAFNPRARSHAGARGLMQLMPRTAKGISSKVSIKDLYRPKKNIQLGLRYFKYLLSKYEGNLIFTLAAYNAGEGNLKKWQRKLFVHDDPLVNIEQIPFKETRNYVKYIYRNYFFYKMLNEEKRPEFDYKKDFFVALN